MAKIIIPTPLRKFTANNSSFEVTKASNVGEAVLELIDQFPDLGKHLLDDDKKIRSFIRIYVGDEDINLLNKEQTDVQADSVLSIVPAIAGGIH